MNATEKQKAIQELDRKLREVEKRLKDADLEEAFLNELRQYKGDDEIIRLGDISREDSPQRMNTGEYSFDNLLGGFGQENLVVFLGQLAWVRHYSPKISLLGFLKKATSPFGLVMSFLFLN